MMTLPRATNVAFAVSIMLSSGSAALAEEPSPFDDAVAVWHMRDTNDAAGKNSRLTAEGDAKQGVALEGAEREASLERGGDGYVADVAGGHFSAGQGADDELNLSGDQMTLLLRVRDPAGQWGKPLFSKHGGHENLVFNVFSSGSGNGAFIGFELGTEGVGGMRQLRAPLGKLGPTDWHDVVVRYDGKLLQLFVDGKVQDEYVAAGALRQGNSEPCTIGAEAHDGTAHGGFKGQVDHAALWQRALSHAEIAELSGVEKLEIPDLYQLQYRPQYHFSALRHWINDPNGLVYYKGEYHMYFQYMPPGREGAYKDWGHALSTDLVHWKQLPTALAPHKDLGGCWSGSAVVDHENTSGFATEDEKPIVAFVTLGGTPGKGPPCTQAIAYSVDRGRTFTYYEGNPVIAPIVVANRDPKVVWHAPSKRWIKTFYLRGNDFALFSSPDLKNWKRLADLRLPGASECPDMFELAVDGDPKNTKWVFWGANGRHLIGEFDGEKFHIESEALLADYGANFYAAQTWSDIPESDGRRIQVAWMRVGQYPGMPFTQQMSFPTEVTLRTTPDGIRMHRVPVRELATIRKTPQEWTDLDLRPGDNPLVDLTGELFEIQAEIDLGDAKNVGFKIRGHDVGYSVAEEKITALGRPAPLKAENNRIKLQILVDRTTVEVFANDGRIVLTSCFVPSGENKTFGMYASGGDAKVVSMKVYPLKSIWPPAETVAAD